MYKQIQYFLYRKNKIYPNILHNSETLTYVYEGDLLKDEVYLTRQQEKVLTMR